MHLADMSVRQRWLVAAAAAGLLGLAGCGGGDDEAASANDDSSVAQDDTGSAAETPEGFDVPEGVPLADGLIPELSEIPLPDSPAVFEVGTAYDADVDPRETAVQRVHFTLAPQEVQDFYRTALPEGGFVIDSDSGDVSEGQQAVVEFTDPDGLPGSLFITSGAWSESSININLYRSGIS